ncbi:MAG: oligosaccharide flippase family protein [Eubacteriales bacterium]
MHFNKFDGKKESNLKTSAKKGTFLQGAFILTISTAFVKLAGLLFTIPIANMLGGDGMGYFYTAYDIYNMFAVLASAGLPVAVSRMVSETLVSGNTDEADRIYTVSVRIFTILGAVIAAIMFFGADVLAALIKNPNAGMSIRALSVTAFCAFVMSALRGYFQGHSIMKYTAVSQVIEAFAKLVFGCLLAYVLLRTEYEYIGGSAGAILGVSIGAVLAVVYLLVNKKHLDRDRAPCGMPVRSDRTILKELFKIAVPVSLGSSVMSLVNLVDTTVIMRVLQDSLGYTYEHANWLYGVFGNAKKIFNFPSAFIVPFSVSILPVLTAAFTARDKEGVRTNLITCFKYALLLALPAGVGITVLSEPIMHIIYFNTPEEAAAGAPLLAVYGIAVILYAVVSISGAILQAFGHVNRPLISLTVGGIIKCALNAVLVGVASVNIMGAPLATCLCYVVMIAMNLVFLRDYLSGCGAILRNTAKTLAAALLMGAFAYFTYPLLSGFFGVRMGGLAAICGAAIVYAVLVLVFKVVTVRELKSMLRRG